MVPPPPPPPPPQAAATPSPRSPSNLDLLEAPPTAATTTTTTRTVHAMAAAATSHSHHPSYAHLFALQRLDEATLRRLNAPPPAPPAAPTTPAPPAAASLAQGLREALAAGQKVAIPVLLFMAAGCCHLIGWGLLVYGTFAVAASSSSASSASPGLLPINNNGGGSRHYHHHLLRVGDAKGLGFLLYMASVLACGLWLHGFIRRKREALAGGQGQGQMVRSPGPMGA